MHAVATDQFGHVPLLTHGRYCSFFQRFGLAGLHADDQDVVALARIYWFTVEFGLVREGGERKAFGAGLMSSYDEMLHAFAQQTPVYPLDLEEIAARPFITTDLQPCYYEAESFASLADAFDAWAIGRGLLNAT